VKITDIEAIILKQPSIELIGDGSQDTVVILAHTDEGITGIGEVDSSPYVTRAIIDAQASHMACMGLREAIVGEDAFDVEKIWLKMYERSLYYGRRGAAIHAMSGIDIAIWDALGKKMGLPVAKLLGGVFRDRIRAYCSVLMPPTEDEIKKLAERHMPKGYLGLKLGWGAFGQSFENDIRLVRYARAALGDGKYLMADIGMRWTDVKGAISAAKAFAQSDVYWIEEPFSPDSLDSYSRLASSTDMRIAGGEEYGTLYEFRDLIARGCVDVLQPDLSRCGGLTVARKLTDMAMMNNLAVIPHAFKTNILMAATLQYIASLPRAMFLEFCEQDTVLRRQLTTGVFSIGADGYVDIPQKPGLGIELDWEAVQRYRVL